MHRGAFHEAGHAVMARLLHLKLGTITIDPADPHAEGHTCIEETGPENTMHLAAAGNACVRAFGCTTLHDQAAFSDEVKIGNALHELYPCDEASHPQRRLELIEEVERKFMQSEVQAAVEALVAALMRTGELSGAEATSIIDRHLRANDRPSAN